MKRTILPLALILAGLITMGAGCSKQSETGNAANQQATSTKSSASTTPTQTTTTKSTTTTAPKTTAPKTYVAPKTTTTKGQNRYVSIKNGVFVPSLITIKVNDTLIWKNEGDIAQVIIADDNSFESPPFYKGATYSHKFTTKGYLNYHLKFYNTVTGQVIVSN